MNEAAELDYTAESAARECDEYERDIVMSAQTQAVAVRDVKQAVQALDPAVKAPVTAAQAKVEAVASLTFKAYERASLLQLSEKEIQALQAEFPDEAFKPGAAGKDNLIYIEHAYLRDRLNQVIGIGQWALIPRNRWAEDYKTAKGTPASRVYVEAMLVVRGCFVSEAVGEMEYFPNNASQNYGDAVEGAKTAALRRCCKEFGIGLQAWKKDWCEGWWARKRNGHRPPAPEKQAPPSAPKPSATSTAAATPEQHAKMLAMFNEDTRELAREFFERIGAIMPNEGVEDVPLAFVPTTKGQAEALLHAIDAFATGEEARLPYPQNGASVVAATKAKDAPLKDEPWSGVNAPYMEIIKDEPWRSFEMPFGKDKGTPLGKLPKATLFGWWANYEVETEYNGRPKKPETIAKDKQFRSVLDEVGKHYQFTKKD